MSSEGGDGPSLAVTPGSSFIDRYVAWFDRWMPDSMVIVFILTVIVAIIALVVCGSPIFTSIEGHVSLVDAWAGGFWGLLDFAMQMCLIMITGSMFANAPPVKRLLSKMAKWPNTQNQALLLSLVTGTILRYFHWGLGMMGGIVIGREILAQAKLKGVKIHEPTFVGLMVCCQAYAGAGPSQSAPLFATTPGRLASLVPAEYASRIELYSLAETMLRPAVFFQIAFLSVVAWFFIQRMMPKKQEDYIEISDDFCKEILKAGEMPKPNKSTFAGWMNNTYFFNILISVAGLCWIGSRLMKTGVLGLSINNYNFIVLMLALLLTGTPARTTKCVVDSVGSTWGVIIQFPFYAGIFGIITKTGLAGEITHAFINVANQHTFPAIAFMYSAFLNMFVPSGGSKFIIEAPYILPAALELNASIPATVNAYVFGDLTTNIIQPFWVLPLITMFKTKFSRIMPFSLIFCGMAFVFHVIVFLAVY